MKPQIGDFTNDRAALTARGGILGRDDHLGGLLADLLQNLVQPLVVQAGHVGLLRVGVPARGQCGRQLLQYVTHRDSPYIWAGSFNTSSVMRQTPSSSRR